MSVSAELLAILACPSVDHAPLRLETDAAGSTELVCTSCLSRFPVTDGIPVLLADEATPGPRGLGVAADAPAPDSADAPASLAPDAADAPVGFGIPAEGQNE